MLPVLEAELGPGIAEALVRTAEQQEDAEAFDEMIQETIEDIVEHAEAGISVSVAPLAANLAAPRNRIIRLVVDSEFGVSLTRTQTVEVARLVTDWSGQGPIDLLGRPAVRHGGRLPSPHPAAFERVSSRNALRVRTRRPDGWEEVYFSAEEAAEDPTEVDAAAGAAAVAATEQLADHVADAARRAALVVAAEEAADEVADATEPGSASAFAALSLFALAMRPITMGARIGRSLPKSMPGVAFDLVSPFVTSFSPILRMCATILPPSA